MEHHAVAPSHRVGAHTKPMSKPLAGFVLAVVALVLLIQTNGGISSWDNLLQTNQYPIPRPIDQPIQKLQQSPNVAPVATAYVYPVATAVPAQATNPSTPIAFARSYPVKMVPKQALEGEAPAEPAPAAPEASAVPEPQIQPAVLPPAPASGPPSYVQAQPYPQPPQQYAPQYQQQQPAGYGYPPPAPSGGTCTPCSNLACDHGTIPGGCFERIPTAPGFACVCPAAVQRVIQTPPPLMGSAEWKEIRSNQYGQPLAINETEAETGLTVAKYEAGQVAYQLSRYLRHKANMARIQAQIGDVILKDLKSAQPCRLVPGGVGGYRCAKSDDDVGDVTDSSATIQGSPKTPVASTPTKTGVLGLGFFGL